MPTFDRSNLGFVRSLLFALALSGSAMLSSSCAPANDLVELRLFPCDVAGGDPRAVAIELTAFDAAGEIVETFDTKFEDISAQVFDDGYATVGYRADASVVTARVRVGWFSTPEAGAVDDAEQIVV